MHIYVRDEMREFCYCTHTQSSDRSHGTSLFIAQRLLASAIAIVSEYTESNEWIARSVTKKRTRQQ